VIDTAYACEINGKYVGWVILTRIVKTTIWTDERMDFLIIDYMNLLVKKLWDTYNMKRAKCIIKRKGQTERKQ
jgi:hypothetical protein